MNNSENNDSNFNMPKRKTYTNYLKEKEMFEKEAELLRRRQENDRINNQFRNYEEDEEIDENDFDEDDIEEETDKKNELDNYIQDSNYYNEDYVDNNFESRGMVDNVLDSAKEKAKDKIRDSAKNVANKATTSVKNVSKEATKKITRKFTTFFMKYGWIVAIAAGIIFLIVLLMVLLGGDGGGSGESDQLYDYTKTVVNVTNSYANAAEKIDIASLDLKNFAMGVVYAEYGDELLGKSEDQIKEIFKAATIVAKSRTLSIGKYVYTDKKVEIQSGTNGLAYCSPYEGCKIVNNNGFITYAPKTLEVPGTIIGEMNGMNQELTSYLNDAYDEVEYEIIVPTELNQVLESYTYEIPYSENVKNIFMTNGGSYAQLIAACPEFQGFKIYNIKDYSNSPTYTPTGSWWWPIGSKETTNNNGVLYASANPYINDYYNDPAHYDGARGISSKFGKRSAPTPGASSDHMGIDIPVPQGTPIIASKDGNVIKAHNLCNLGGNCPKGGNEVKIDHGDGISTYYAHASSVIVKAGDTVKQGQVIAYVGSTGVSTGPHLHFGVYLNSQAVNPIEYVSLDNPRSQSSGGGGDVKYVEDKENKKAVCLSLKASGFSNNAVAGFMVNIEAESANTWDPSVPGDKVNGVYTSLGLCQWHLGRKTNLINFCGNEVYTVKCQLSFLMHELNSEYQDLLGYFASPVNSAQSMANQFCVRFERPENTISNCANRAASRTQKILTYVNNNCS